MREGYTGEAGAGEPKPAGLPKKPVCSGTQAALAAKWRMLLRLSVLLICLAATGWYLHGKERAGHLQRVDEHFLDFLVANARDRFNQPDPEAGGQVVLVRMREEDAGEYAGWPPPPLDWQTVLKSLHSYAPSVVVIATPLTWGRPAPDFVPAVAEALMPFPSTVLGVEAKMAEPGTEGPAFMGDFAELLPRFQRVEGDVRLAPRLASLISGPDRELRNQAEVGLLGARQSKEAWLLPYAARVEGQLAPSVLAQALARHSRSPYSLQRLRLGAGAGTYLQQGLYVPLEPSGEMKITSHETVPSVNALNLMTGTLADGTDDADKAALGTGKIIVIGFDRETAGTEPRLARLYAQALAQALALPRLQMLSPTQQWVAWAAALLGALWLTLRVRRSRALWAGALLVFLALLTSYLVFQSGLTWFPPTMPAAFLVVGALVGAILGRKEIAVTERPQP